MTSPTATTWTARSASEANTWNSVTYGNDTFVAVSSDGTNRVMTSATGTTWTARSASEANSWQSVTYGNGTFVAVAKTGTNRVMTSATGTTWTARSAVAANSWYSVTYGNGLFVAVSSATTTGNAVMTSPDGITWTPRTAAEANTWQSVTYGNGLFVAVSGVPTTTGNSVMTSPDGIIWTPRTVTESNSWNSVTYGNGLFVAVATYGPNGVMTSPDGITWTPRTGAEANIWQSITYGNGLFVAVSKDGTNRVMRSPGGGHPLFLNGTSAQTISGTLTDNSTLPSIVLSGSGTKTFNNNASTTDFIIAASSGNVTAPSSLTLTGNLSNASTLTAPATLFVNNDSSTQYATGTFTGTSALNDVIFSGGGEKTLRSNASTTDFTISTGATVNLPLGLSVSGNYVNNGINIVRGRVWTARSAAAANSWQSITYGNGLFVAVANGATTTGNAVMTSPDGITWTARSAAEANNWYSVTYGNGLFVAVSSNGTNRVMTSATGTTWTARSAVAANSWYGITYGNGLFVAVGNATTTGNAVMTSPDGITWTPRTASVANTWNSVTYGNGLFVAVANGGTQGTDFVMTSPDGITWTPRTVAEAKPWQAVTYGNGLFVAVSYSGINRLMTSPDGITWTPRSGAEANQWYSVTYGNGTYVAVSADGANRVMTSITSTTTFNGASAQSISGSLIDTDAMGNVAFAGAGTKTFSSNASTTNFTIQSGATTVAPASLTVGGNYLNSGTFTTGSGTTTFNGDAQILSGTMTGSSAWNTLVFEGNATKTIASNASTTNLVNGTSATTSTSTLVAPAQLSIAGNFTQFDSFVAGTGTTTFNGTSLQTATGTMTGTSAFNNLAITNITGTTTFGAPVQTADTFSMSPSTTAAFVGNSTSTFQNISLQGSSGQYVTLRSTASGTPWGLSVAGTQKAVTYVNVKDSHACSGNPDISAADGTSVDAGGNTCWTFAAPGATSISTASNQTFALSQASTPLSTITVTDASTPTVTAANDIRIKIATSTVHMLFDTTDTTVTLGGTASGKVSGTVSYEGSGSVLVLNVTNDFAGSDTLTISDLAYTSFSATNTATTSLRVYMGGASDITADAVDDKTVTITGSLTIAEHTIGQVADSFSFVNDTNVELFRYRLTPAGESDTITSTVITLSGIQGVLQADLTNLKLYKDNNSDGLYDAGDTQIGGSPTLALTDQSGTITFSTSYTATTSYNYVLVGDVANLSPGDHMNVSLTTTNITATGALTSGTIVPAGTVTARQHIKGGLGATASEVGGNAPTGQGVRGGGGNRGGNTIDTNTNGTILTDETGSNAPTANGTPQNQWTTAANGYNSDGTYATAAQANYRQSYSTFNMSIPGTNQITGIEVKIEASGSTAAGSIEVALSWDGGTSSTTLKSTGTLTGTDAVYTLGGQVDTWGHSWTPAELANGSFQIEVSAQPSANTVQIDAIRVHVYHQATGGGGGGGSEVRLLVPAQYAEAYRRDGIFALPLEELLAAIRRTLLL